MCTISLRSRSRNEIFISNFKGFVLLLPTQTFFYFMAIETRYVCEEDNETYLFTFQDENIISICISQNNEINSIHLTKSDIIELITELNLSLKNLI